MRNLKKTIGFILVAFFIIPVISYSQNNSLNKSNRSYMHHEQQKDNYMPGPTLLETSPGYKFESSLFFTTQVNVNEDGNNILNDAANEPSIAIDPVNPNRMVIGWRQFDNVLSDFRQAGYGYTEDGGQTWTFPGVIEPGVFRSDPVLDCDSEGKFYYNSLTKDDNSNYWCNVYRNGSRIIRLGQWSLCPGR